MRFCNLEHPIKWGFVGYQKLKRNISTIDNVLFAGYLALFGQNVRYLANIVNNRHFVLFNIILRR